MNLIQLNLLASILIVIFLIFRKILGNRLTGKQLFTIWCVLVSTFFLPFEWSRILLKQPSILPLKFIYAPLIAVSKKAELFVQNALDNSGAISNENISLFSWIPHSGYGWLCLLASFVTAILLLYFFGSYYFSVRKLKYIQVDNQPLITTWKEDHPLFRKFEIVCSSHVSSPFTYGFIRPRIVLPKRMLNYSQTELFLILDHEYYHIRHFDALFSSIFLLLCCINWFNPFIWLMFKQIKQDLEMACDENVLNHQKTDLRRQYALLLVQEIERKASSALNLGFAKNIAKSRITNIMLVNQKKSLHNFFSFLSIVVVLCFLMFSYTINEGVFLTVYSSSTHALDNPTVKANSMTYEEITHLVQNDWWTYDEYKEFLRQEKKDLIQLRDQGIKGFSAKEVDETLQIYEGILQDIKNGTKYSKSVSGDESSAIVLK